MRVEIAFHKVLHDPVSGETLPSATWRRNHFTRIDGGISMLSDLLDEFVLDYLRVNEGHCR